MVGSVGRGEEHEATTMEEKKNRELRVRRGGGSGEVEAEIGAMCRV
jgi:hypothetical protein